MIKNIKKNKFWFKNIKWLYIYNNNFSTDQKLDFYILALLENEFLSQKLDYVNINDIYKKSHLKNIWVSVSYFRRRVFYNILIWNLSLKKVENLDKKFVVNYLRKRWVKILSLTKRTKYWWLVIDKSLYYKYFLYVKITKKWISALSSMRKEIDKSKFELIFNKFRKYWEYFLFTKKVIISLFAVLSWLFVYLYMFFDNEDMLKKYSASINLISDESDDFFYDPHDMHDYFIERFFDNFDLISDLLVDPDSISELNFRQISNSSALIKLIDEYENTYYFEIRLHDDLVVIRQINTINELEK